MDSRKSKQETIAAGTESPEVKVAETRKSRRKVEAVQALQFAKAREQAARAAEKNARTKEIKAARLMKKAEMLHSAAQSARAQAMQARDTAAAARKLAEEKVTAVRVEAGRLRAAKSAAKFARMEGRKMKRNRARATRLATI